MEDRIKWIIEAIVASGGKPISEAQDIFFDAGLDSLGFAEIVADLEERHRLEIRSDAMLSDWTVLRTPAGLAEALEEYHE